MISHHTFLENIINTALKYDPDTQAKLIHLQHKILAIKFVPINFCLYFKGSDKKLEILMDKPSKIAATISGTPLQFLRLLNNSDLASQKKLFTEEMSFEGDPLVANEWQKLFKQIDIDWEEPLSYIFPDLIVHEFGKQIRACKAWFTSRCDANQKMLTEWLQEEIRVLPTEEEIADFYQDIIELNIDTSRIEARINFLSNKKIKDSP